MEVLWADFAHSDSSSPEYEFEDKDGNMQSYLSSRPNSFQLSEEEAYFRDCRAIESNEKVVAAFASVLLVTT